MLVKEYQTLAHLHIVRGSQGPVQPDEGPQQLGPVISGLDQGHDHSESVGQHVTHKAVGQVSGNSSLKDIQPLSLNGNTKSLAILTKLETSLIIDLVLRLKRNLLPVKYSVNNVL